MFSRKLTLTVLGLAFVAVGTYLAIRWGQGYRPTKEGLKGTGLLAATSNPQGAQVFINGRLTTATDDTLNLPPGEYQIEIKKDGYFTWQKTVNVEAELVTQTNTTLFSSVVSLSPLTFSGAKNPIPSPDGTKIAFVVKDAATPAENGLYVYDLSDSPLALRSKARLIARNSSRLNLETAAMLWSPDSSQILIHENGGSDTTGNNVLIDIDRLNDLEGVGDVSARLPIIFSQWEQTLTLEEAQRLAKLPKIMQIIATTSATNIYFSPDGEKMLYTATDEISIPEDLIANLPARSTQPEERQLKPRGVYIYDLKEDKNFRLNGQEEPSQEGGEGEEGETVETIIKTNLVTTLPADLNTLAQTPEASPSAFTKLQDVGNISHTIAAFKAYYSALELKSYQWFPSSRHLIISKPEGIEIIEYDGTNRVSLYSGPRNQAFIYPWPDGSKLIILTNLGSNGDTPENLYAISLK